MCTICSIVSAEFFLVIKPKLFGISGKTDNELDFNQTPKIIVAKQQYIISSRHLLLFPRLQEYLTTETQNHWSNMQAWTVAYKFPGR